MLAGHQQMTTSRMAPEPPALLLHGCYQHVSRHDRQCRSTLWLQLRVRLGLQTSLLRKERVAASPVRMRRARAAGGGYQYWCF